MSPPPQLIKEQILQEARREPSLTRAAYRHRVRVLLLLAMAWMAGVFWIWGGIRPYERPGTLILETFGGALGILLLAFWGIWGRNRSMLGRPTGWRWAFAIGVPVCLMLWKIGWSLRDPAMMAFWPDKIGYRCLGLGLCMAAVPMGVLLHLRRRSEPNEPALGGASLGVLVGAATWALTDLWCPVAYVPHLLLGHLLPIVLLALAGAGWGRRYL